MDGLSSQRHILHVNNGQQEYNTRSISHLCNGLLQHNAAQIIVKWLCQI